MKLYDISQEIFSCAVYPGDPKPEKKTLSTMDRGDLYNLTAFSMCAHNGTHIDAPAHFLQTGKTVEQLPLESFVGDCYVAEHEGDLTAADAKKLLQIGAQRILIKGPATVTEEAARVLAGIRLLGNESQTVGPEDAPMAVHKILLEAGTVLLEGIVLQDVPPGRYLLNAAPLNLATADGAPCRAWLMEK